MSKNSLKITVVTVSYNAAATIEKTILSVVDQTYDNIEYIVIDGGSTDGTVDIIKRYAKGGSECGKHNNYIFYWVSEPDKGIYDAMNKGIAAATGNYINFMNAGDKFYSLNVIELIFKNNDYNYNVIYGSTFMSYSYGNYIVVPDKLSKITKCMTLCHQSVFLKISEAKKHLFKEEYGLVADHGSLLEIYRESPNSFYQYDGIIAKYDAQDGISSKNALKSYKHQAILTNANDSIFRKLRIIIRAFMPQFIVNPLGRLFFKFNRRYKRV